MKIEIRSGLVKSTLVLSKEQTDALESALFTGANLSAALDLIDTSFRTIIREHWEKVKNENKRDSFQ